MVSVMERGKDYLMAEYYTFKDKFITPFLGSESDKKAFVITSASDPIINMTGQFYSVRVDIHGKTAFIRYSTIIEVALPTLQVENGSIKLSTILEQLFSTANYIAYTSSDEEFVNWLRNSNARLVIRFKYSIIGNDIYGLSEVGVYKGGQIIFSVGIMHDGKKFYPAYFKLTQPFLRLKIKTQERIITHLLKSLFSVKKVSTYRVKGFDDEVQEEVVVSQVIADMVKKVIPAIIKAGKQAFLDESKPIACIYVYEDGEVKKQLLNIKPPTV